MVEFCQEVPQPLKHPQTYMPTPASLLPPNRTCQSEVPSLRRKKQKSTTDLPHLSSASQASPITGQIPLSSASSNVLQFSPALNPKLYGTS